MIIAPRDQLALPAPPARTPPIHPVPHPETGDRYSEGITPGWAEASGGQRDSEVVAAWTGERHSGGRALCEIGGHRDRPGSHSARFLAKIAILWTIGIILAVIGLILLLLGALGHGVRGRRHYW